MNATIALVGAGRIGQFHLRGLVDTSGITGVQVIDPNEAARTEAASIVAQRNPSWKLALTDDVADAWRDASLTIVATQASDRPPLIESLLANGHRRFVLEKLVCQSEDEYESLLALLATSGARAWINTPRRYNAFFQLARTLIAGDRMSISVVGSQLGLGSNTIHFADAFLMVKGECKLAFRRDRLAPTLLPNKRGPDLCEFEGTLEGEDSGGSILSVTSLPLTTPVHTITISSEHAWLFADEVAGTCQWSRGVEKWKTHSDLYRESRVSQVTPHIVSSILATGECLLPNLIDLYEPHCALFRVFREHISTITGITPDRCPVT